jgi:hypothetical protein
MSAKSVLKALLPPKWRHAMRERVVSRSVTHLFGPRSIRLARHEAVVTCVVKNGEFYLDSFIRHYSRMGFRHIFILDNGSTDQTISIAKSHNNVSVCASSLPIQAHQGSLKKYLARTSAVGGWCLDADVDEFFDYPFSDRVELRQFLEYLNRMGYTAVVTQLLDMFSDKPLSDLAHGQESDLRTVYQYYDISAPTKVDYRTSDLVAKHGQKNTISNRDTALYFGGIRKTLYGSDCLLTKHSLFLPGGELDPFPHVHFVNNARLSDVSCVMLHYKLTSNALEIALQNKEGFTILKGYDDFIDFLTSNPGYQIKQKTAVKFQGAEDLVKAGFLFISDTYRDYVKSVGLKDAVCGPNGPSHQV